MLETIKYCLFSALNPRLRDYIDMGFGIEARYRRCKPFWDKHLKLSKDFTRKSLEGASGSLLILGAGRLYDIDLGFLARIFSLIHLVDSDPSVLPIWKKTSVSLKDHCRLQYSVADVTGCIHDWTQSLKEFLRERRRQHDEVASFFLSLALKNPPIFIEDANSNKPISVLSINLLGQIPIYWRDRAIKLLKRYGFNPDDPLLSQALEASMGKLQRHHLDHIASLKPAHIVLIYDRRFYYYRKDTAQWQEERSLFHPSLAIDSPHYSLRSHSSWLWHIAPQDIEQRGYGIIHEIEACHYSSKLF